MIYNNDLQTECATEVDKDGWSVGRLWYCGSDCQTHEEALTWRTDETFKMTLQYDNKALWTGLELYGCILLWIFPIGLILTIGVPIAGKVTVQY